MPEVAAGGETQRDQKEELETDLPGEEKAHLCVIP